MCKILPATNESAKSLFNEADTEKAFLPRVSDPNFTVSDFLNKMKVSQGYMLFVSQTELGENCGFISLLPNKEKISYSIGPMYIKREYRGKSIGKFLTGTRAVKEDGSYLEIKDALLRGFCRIIPFNIFSALGNTCYPWHDSLSKTYVIDERESQFPM